MPTDSKVPELPTIKDILIRINRHVRDEDMPEIKAGLEAIMQRDRESAVKEARLDELKQLVDMRSQHPRELKLKATSIVNKRIAELEKELTKS